ncbi:MAG: acyloxyacyl hydrolase [Bacteroidetes bacterium]|nr:acyloxyacyl hydrolase [Bacteroidota bacterium]
MAPAHGQNPKRLLRSEVGFRLSFPVVYEHLPEAKYQPILVQGYMSWHLGATHGLDNKKGHFMAYIEPQVNPVLLSGRLSDLELGCNGGIRYQMQLNANNQLYWAVGTGPHYITVRTRTQHRGYIFSDNFIMGWQHALGERLRGNIQYHFRHISNAGIMRPNQGIDNHFVSLGVLRQLR